MASRLMCAQGRAVQGGAGMRASSATQELSTCNGSVAVIGAGAAGLVATRELKREKVPVQCYEMHSNVGGVWAFTDDAESDLLGTSASSRVHSSLYASLRTNLPREVMSFSDFGFLPTSRSVDTRRFPRHEEVQLYLEDFASTFNLYDSINLGKKVLQATTIRAGADASGSADGWRLRTKDMTTGEEDVHEHRALIVANGHYSDPYVPPIAGQDNFPGLQMHTHNYRRPNEWFASKRIVVLGASASGEDISRELAKVARDVYLCSRGMPQVTEDGHTQGLWRHGAIEELRSDGSVLFDNGQSLNDVDVVMYATGYRFNVDFLEEGLCETGNNWIWPLYEHVLHSELNYRLAYIGVPVRIIPFPQMELQSRWVARILSGALEPPSAEELQCERKRLEHEVLEPNGPVAKRHAHVLGKLQFPYNDRLSERIGEPALPAWREQMYSQASQRKRELPADYKDSEPVSMELVQEARRDLFESDPRFTSSGMELEATSTGCVESAGTNCVTDEPSAVAHPTAAA